MKKLLRSLAAVALGLSLTTGVAAASSSVNTTGPDSVNTVKTRNVENRHVRNNNNLAVRNNNPQRASSGDATADRNTTGGNAHTGAVKNDSLLRGSVTIDNGASKTAGASAMSTGSQSGSINKTGPDSVNRVSFVTRNNTKVTNNNDLCISNNNSQSAHSGTAVVSRNTTGGSATSGNVSNISTVDLNVRVLN